MSPHHPILAAIKTHVNLGQTAAKMRWPVFVKIFTHEIELRGNKIQGSQDDLKLFTFESITKAIQATFFAIQTARKTCDWRSDAGDIPIQILLHATDAETSLPFRETNHEFWTQIPFEKIYITDSLKTDWQELHELAPLPPIAKQPAYKGCHRLLIKSKNQAEKQLYTGRAVFIQGEHSQCFYCGMYNHSPGDCPSKKITMANRSLDDLGYLPIPRINELVPKAFKNYLELMKKLIEGVKPASIKRIPELLVLTAFLDIYILYQFRYLWQISFDEHFTWKGATTTGELIFDNKNLQLGLDSLRVGEYETATKLLNKESRLVKSTVACFAHIGLAFVALENDNFAAMERHLERGRDVARTQQQKVYVHLLLTRYYELADIEWKLKEVMSDTLTLNFDSLDLQYRKLQTSVRGLRNPDHIKTQIKDIIRGNKEFFLIALMDPALIPCQGQLNSLAQEEFKNIRKNAAQKMLQAKDDFYRLQPWFDKKDKFIHDQFKAMKQMGKQLQTQSYYDLLDVAERCTGLINTCDRVLEEKKKFLKKELQRITNVIRLSKKTWQHCNFKNQFKTFQTELLYLENQFKKTDQLFKQDSANSYHQATTMFLELTKSANKLMHRQKKMATIATWIKGGKLFGKRLVIINGILLILCTVLYLSQDPLRHSDFKLVAEFARNPAMFKTSSIISFLVIGPSIALTWAIKTTIDSMEIT